MCWKRLEKRAMMHTLNKRQGKWNGGMLRGDYKNGHRRNNGGSENKRKTKTDDVRLDEVRWIWNAERRGSTAKER